MNEFASSPEDNDIIAGLPAELGFVENGQLTMLRRGMSEAGASGDEQLAKELFLHYGLQAEVVVNQQQGDDFLRAQIGLIVAKALAWKDAKRDDYFRDELLDALEYAENMGYEDVAAKIRKALEGNSSVQ